MLAFGSLCAKSSWESSQGRDTHCALMLHQLLQIHPDSVLQVNVSILDVLIHHSAETTIILISSQVIVAVNVVLNLTVS